MFLTRFFKRSDVALEIDLFISKEINIEVSKSNQIGDDKSLMLFATLFYARLLRVVSSYKEKDDLTKNFIIWFEEFEQSSYNEKVIELFLNIYIKFPYNYIPKHLRKAKLRKAMNGNFYIDVGVIKVDPLSYIIYPVFEFVWKQISSANKKILCDAFSLLSTHYILNKYTIKSAVDIPNRIVNDLLEIKN